MKFKVEKSHDYLIYHFKFIHSSQKDQVLLQMLSKKNKSISKIKSEKILEHFAVKWMDYKSKNLYIKLEKTQLLRLMDKNISSFYFPFYTPISSNPIICFNIFHIILCRGRDLNPWT